MISGAWLLTVALLAPPVLPPPAAPRPSLGQALDDVGAFAPGLDHSLHAPVPPARMGARTLVLTGLALVGAGLAGMILSPGCVTRDAQGRCVHHQGSDDLYPALLVLGLGASTTGAYWMRRDLRVEDR